MIQVQGGKDKQRTFIIVSNLSSRGQHVCFDVMDRILSREIGSSKQETSSALSMEGPSVYLNANTGQFGSSAAVYWIKPRETSVFIRVKDPEGSPCGPSAALARAGYGPAMLKSIQMDEPVYLIATKGGHILPTTEIKSFERDARHQDRLTVRFWPSFFARTITIWLAWRSFGKLGEAAESEVEEMNRRLTLNGQALNRCSRLILGSGLTLASCTLHIHPRHTT